jgi:DNA-binding transcriptional LysR family regulator
MRITRCPQDLVRDHVAKHRLVHVLKDWTPPASGYHLYYPRRRQPMRALSVLVDALRCATGISRHCGERPRRTFGTISGIATLPNSK